MLLCLKEQKQSIVKPKQKVALLQNSPFRNPTDKKSLKNKDNFLKKSPNLLFRNSAKVSPKSDVDFFWQIFVSFWFF